ncbi:MAG: sialate O-acetylesterase [Cocleimonas sp.]
MLSILKKHLIFTTLLLIFSSSIQAKELVFVLAGQSNMVGQGKASELAPAYRRAPRNVEYYYNGYKAPLNRFQHFGPEIGFAHEISRQFPHDTIKLIKFAVGGTSLFAWDPLWDATKANSTRNISAGPLFKKLIKTVNIQFDGSNSELAGILWMQGETDAKYLPAAQQYAGNLNRFVTALRSALHSPNTPFIMGSINPPLNLFPSTPIVQRAQKVSASRIRNLRLIRTDDLSKRNDHLHYNTSGQLELGKRFARAYLGRQVAKK